ncbi:AMP-binding protein [Sphingomonas bisphenolicum]
MPNPPLARDEIVLRYLLEKRAHADPEKMFVRHQNGVEWTYGEMLARAQRISGALYETGVRQYDNIFFWMPNSPALLETWFGANYMGATFVPANTAYRGGILQHVLNLAQAQVGIVHLDLLPRLQEIEIPHLKKIIVIGGMPQFEIPGIELLDGSFLQQERPAAPLSHPIEPWDNATVIYSSGTTGPSKAVLSSYMHNYSMLTNSLPGLFGPDERLLVFLPMFHVGGTTTVYGQLVNGGSIAMLESFRTKQFWELTRETGATTCLLIGVMAIFLMNQPPSEQDQDHGMKNALIQPMTRDLAGFTPRFGVQILNGYGSTELGVPISSSFVADKVGTCGKEVTGHFECRLVDEYDQEVADGTPGELLVRPLKPWSIFTEYYGNYEATAKAWRNGWFHTGDLMTKDEEGYFFFVDRKKDAIRRRGENVSSFEVESEALRYPGVTEAAVYAVKSDLAEDEVMVCLATAANDQFDPHDFTEFMTRRLAHFMVPRYVRLLPELPKTPTGKIQKVDLRATGVTDDCWDRQSSEPSAKVAAG